MADSKGNVYIVDRSFKTQMFIAYDGGRVTHLKQLKQKNILVTIGVSIERQKRFDSGNSVIIYHKIGRGSYFRYSRCQILGFR